MNSQGFPWDYLLHFLKSPGTLKCEAVFSVVIKDRMREW